MVQLGLIPFYSLTHSELKEIFIANDLPISGPDLLYRFHYKHARIGSCIQDLAKCSIEFVKEHFDFYLPKIHTVQKSSDGTIKFLLELRDQNKVEMVIIPFMEKSTLCISTQVGCAMGCKFCFTGTAGFTRNLTTEEIVGQIVVAKNYFDGKILNLVLMGQGEPLLNFDNVAKAVKIMLEKRGLTFAPQKITISTSGYLPGIKRFKAEMSNVNIALSLHNAFDDERSILMPINNRYPVSTLIDELDAIPEGKLRFVTYEYLLIKGYNDSPRHAEKLIELLKGRKAYINLIPYNPVPHLEFKAPSMDEVKRFREWLKPVGVPITLRTPKGQDILAACGQLKNQFSA